MSILNNLDSSKPVNYMNIEEIFLFDLVVPNIQRFYSWGAGEFNSFIDSFRELYELLSDSREDKARNYLGNIVLTEAEENEKEKKYIIDGQQRLCSFFILLTSFRDVLSSQDVLRKFDPSKLININEEQGNEIAIMKKCIEDFSLTINDLIHKGEEKKDPFAMKRGNENPVLTFDQSDLEEDEAKKILKGEKINSKSLWIKNYNLAREFILKTLCVEENIKDMNDTKQFYEKIHILYQTIFSKTLLLVNIVGDFGDSFSIFEGMNNNGLNLTAFDLVNGWLQSKMNETGISDSTKRKYRTTINAIREGTSKEVNTLLKDYLSFWINSYYNNEISDAKLFNFFQELYKKDNDSERFIKNFCSDLDYLDKFLTDKNYNVYYLDWMKRKKIIPIIYQLKHLDYDEKNINEIIGWLIRYSILFLNFDEKSPGIFQYRIKDVMKYIGGNGRDKKVNPYMICDEVADVRRDFEHYSTDLDYLLKKIEDKEIKDYSLIKTLLIMIYESENSLSILDKEGITFDHSIPKKYEKIKQSNNFDALGEDDNLWKSYINSLGNVVIATFKDNRKKSNNMANLSPELPNEKINNLLWNKIDVQSSTVLFDVDERTRELCKMIKERNILWINQQDM